MFENYGRRIDLGIAGVSDWYASLAHVEQVLLCSLLLLGILWLVRLLLRRLRRAVFGAPTSVKPPESAATTKPAATHAPTRYGVRLIDNKRSIVPLPSGLVAADDKVGRWEYFDVEYVDAVVFVIGKNEYEGVCDPPQVVKPEGADEPVLVYLVKCDGRYHKIAATSDIGTTGLFGYAHVIGGKMLPELADRIIAKATQS